MRRFALAAAAAGLALLAGCSHSCVPHGWFAARTVAPLKQPPGAPPLAHESTYDIPGGPPSSAPTHDEACLVQPPNVIKAKAAATERAPAAATRVPTGKKIAPPVTAGGGTE